MSEDQPETLIPEPVSIPTATPEPTEPAPIPTSTSEPSSVPPEAPEAPTEAESAVPVNNDNTQSSPEESVLEQAAQMDNSSSNEPVSVTSQAPTAQIPANEPFAKLSLLSKAREAIQFRKRRKLEKIMGMFLKQASITNDEVEKLLHVSDATATRYLEQLEKEGKVKQEGRTGTGVSYSRI